MFNIFTKYGMCKVLLLTCVYLSHGSAIAEIVVEDAQDNATTGWIIYDNTPAGAAVNNVLDNTLGSRVIQTTSDGIKNGFRLGSIRNNSSFNVTNQTYASWRMKTNNPYFVYVAVNTTGGLRYLTYSAQNIDRGLINNLYVFTGLGSRTADNQWVTINRDLQADLSEAEPDNTIISVNGFLVRGSMRLDDISFSETDPRVILVEDAQDNSTNGWVVYDNTPSGAAVFNVLDDALGSRVIRTVGDGIKNGFRLGSTNGNTGFNATNHVHASWRINSAEPYFIYIAADTANGFRYLTYSAQNTDRGLINNLYIITGLGAHTASNQWVTINRNLQADLSTAEPGNTITSINGFLVRGSVRLDDISFSETAPTTPVLDLSKYVEVFADEFNAVPGSTLDPSKWDTGMLWGPYYSINNEEQLYVDTLGMHSAFDHTPFEFTGTTLKITATPTSAALQPPPRPPENDPSYRPRPYSEYRYNGPTADGPGYQASDVNYLSGMITSYESLKMTHGYVEMRAKLPGGRGLWPAFWLLNTHYVENLPEIDVMELLGQDTDRLYHTYHYFDIYNTWSTVSTPSFTTLSNDWTQDFHTFGMAWSPTEIIWYVNGIETKRITSDEYTIPNQAMYLLANLAVGGNWPGSPDNSTIFPATMEIDYIRAYERKLDPQLDLANDYQLMFEDNFNGSSLNANKWKTSFLWGPYLPINQEEQYLVDALGADADLVTPSNTPFVLNDGVLSITARKASDPNSFPIPSSLPGLNDPIWTDYASFQRNLDYEPGNYTSGIISSYDSFKFVYGYVETRARIPKGRGLWPAFWLLNGYYVGPQPEVDIFEILGDKPYRAYHTYHRLDASGTPQQTQGITPDYGDPNIGYADDFHIYGLRWQRGRLDWYIDGTLVHTYEGDDVPYQTMYVLADVAIGGSWPGPPDEFTEFPLSFDIDYIRVYQQRHKED